MKFGVISNCQNMSLGRSLKLLLPDHKTIHFGYRETIAKPVKREQAVARLRTCDVVFTADCRTDLEELSPEGLKSICKRVVEIPPVVFGGFHPDTCNVMPSTVKDHARRRAMRGPTGELHSRIAIASYLGGLNIEDAEMLYGRLPFARLGYFDRFGQHRAVLQERFASRDIDLAPLIDGWLDQGAFMHSANHPKIFVWYDIAKLLCQRLGLPIITTRPEEMPDDLEPYPTHPVYPDIADYLGLPQTPGRGFRAAREPGTPPVDLSLSDFLRGSYETFTNAPRRALMRIEGVQEAMGVLGLNDAAA